MSVVAFERYLEASGPGGKARAKRLGISSDELAQLVGAYSEVIRLRTQRAKVLATLGPPARIAEASTSYLLPSRPDYLFTFWFDSSDSLIRSGYTRGDETLRVSPGRLSPSTLKKVRAMGATEEELRAWYGEPDDIVAWWPIETWSYGNLHVELRLGVAS